MSAPKKLKRTPRQTPERIAEKNRKWTRRGIGAAAIAVTIAVAGITAERLLGDDYVALSPEQQKELIATNGHTLSLLSGLSFDAAGHFEGKKEDAQSATSDSLKLDLELKDNRLVIEGEGQHTGVTDTYKNPYEKPTEFNLAYELDGTAATVPMEALKQIMASGRMPIEGNYKRTEKTYVFDREPSPRVHKESIRVKSSPSGAPEEIQYGSDPIFAGSEGALDNAMAFYDSVQAEMEKFIA